MIVWRGWGILVLVLAAVPVALVQLVAGWVMGPDGAARQSDWLAPLGLALSAPLIWWVGRALNRRPARVLVDRETGQEVALRPNHSLFFIRMEYWAVIVALGALVALVVALVSP